MKLGSKLLLISLLGLSVQSLVAQNNALEKQRFEPSIRFGYNLYSGSTNVSSRMAYRLFRGGFISRNTIDKSTSATNIKHRTGYLQESYVEYAFSADKFCKKASNHMYLTFGLEQNSFLGTTYSNDAFRLVFNGNTPFSGKWANADGFQWNQISWRSIGINLLNPPKRKYKKSDNLFISADSVTKTKSCALPKNLFRIGLSLIEGLNYRNINAQDARLFTSEDGLQLDVDANINMQNTSNNYTKSLKGNGVGLAINAGYRASLFKNPLDFYVKDLGFIVFNQVNEGTKDTAFSYNGYFVPQKSFTEQGYFGRLSDSFYSIFNAKKTETNKTVLMPFAISAVYRTGFHSKLELNYRYLKGLLPKLTYIKEKPFGKNAALYGMLSFGGFDYYDINLAYTKIFKSCAVSLGLNSLEALAFPGSQQGFGGYFKFIVNTAFVSE